MDDYRRSIKRINKSEEYRGRSGFGFTGQSGVIIDQYLPQLAEWIGTSLADKRRSRDVRRALRYLNDEQIARRLLIAGISVAMGKRFGVDEDDNQTPIGIRTWLGYNFNPQTRDAAFRTGEWGITGLCSLPIFDLDDDDLLTIAVSDDIRAEMDDFIRSAAAHHPLLSLQERPPAPWNGFRSGGLHSDDWAKPQLIRTAHKSIETIIRKAIATGAMQPVLDAINALQSMAFVINRPMLDFVRLVGPPSPEEFLFKTDKKPKRGVSKRKALKRRVRELKTAIENWQYDIAVAETALGDRYAPLTMDTRGRLVPIPWLNFIREDRVRSVIQFANGEPINKDGVVWLKQFVARLADGNTFSDESKPSRLDLDGRVAWAHANQEKVCSFGAAILWGGIKPDLNGIDDPFQFAAACAELARVTEAAGDGSDLITRLPIQFDASCSGLQHLCAMARADEGQYVHLAPAATKPPCMAWS